MSDSAANTAASGLMRTPLYDLHVRLGARMVPFAGYEMPVQYPLGILKEHLHTRAAAGLFDVSHMGQIALKPRSGAIADAARALEALVPVDVAGLTEGRQRYAVFTNDTGGILDDLMVAQRGNHLLLIVNAACKAADEAHLRAHLSSVCEIERLGRALLALQGPKAAAVLETLAPGAGSMRFMDVRDLTICGAACVASRSGYTGEDGYEISVPVAAAIEVAEALLAHADVQPIGLGARDSLRLEAGLPLYGSDLDAATTPVESGLSWAISKARRAGGARTGGFPGATVILDQLDRGATKLHCGLKPDGRQPVREGTPLFADASAAAAIGHVTSGGFGPSINGPVAMGTLPIALTKPGTRVYAEVRGKRVPVDVVSLPFVAHTYHRG